MEDNFPNSLLGLEFWGGNVEITNGQETNFPGLTPWKACPNVLIPSITIPPTGQPCGKFSETGQIPPLSKLFVKFPVLDKFNCQIPKGWANFPTLLPSNLR